LLHLSRQTSCLWHGRRICGIFVPLEIFSGVGREGAVPLPHRVPSRAGPVVQLQRIILAYLVQPVKRQEVCISVWSCRGEFTSRLTKLETQSSAKCGSAAPSCGRPSAFRPVPRPPSSSAQAGRLSLPACAEGIAQDARPTERRRSCEIIEKTRFFRL